MLSRRTMSRRAFTGASLLFQLIGLVQRFPFGRVQPKHGLPADLSEYSGGLRCDLGFELLETSQQTAPHGSRSPSGAGPARSSNSHHSIRGVPSRQDSITLLETTTQSRWPL